MTVFKKLTRFATGVGIEVSGESLEDVTTEFDALVELYSDAPGWDLKAAARNEKTRRAYAIAKKIKEKRG